MHTTKKQKTKKLTLTAMLVRCACAFLMVSMLVSLVSNRVEIAQEKQKLEELQLQIAAQEADNEELSILIESGETEMVERVAREEYGYAAPNERIFVDMSGK